MKNKITIIVLSVISTVAIGISVYSAITLNQKYKELENSTKINETEIETSPIEVASDNYNQRFEDLSNRIAELETKLSQSEEKIVNLENQLTNYSNINNLSTYINNFYTSPNSNRNLTTITRNNLFDVCLYNYLNNDTDNEYYKTWCN